MVDGDAKALSRLTLADGRDVYLASQNRGSLEVYALQKQNNRLVVPEPLDSKALLTYADGKIQLVEIPYGAGFLTQSSRKLTLSPEVTKVELINYQGESRVVETVQ